MSSNSKIILFTSTLALLALLGGLLLPRPVSWDENYSRYQDSPFGTKFIHEILNERTGVEMVSVPVPPSDFLRSNIETEGKTWINISMSYNPDSLEVSALAHQVENGMNAFIATRPGRSLTNWLGLTYSGPARIPAPALFVLAETGPELLPISFEQLEPQQDEFQGIDLFLEARLNTRADALGSQITTLAKAEGRTIFVRVQKGEGAVYLLASPMLLTNYTIWDPDTEPTAAAILSHLPDTPLLWDDYYELGSEAGNHPLRVLLAQPSLRAGWYTMLILCVIFLLFRVKRIARPLPEISKPQNTSLIHIQKMSQLYQEVDRKGRITDKRIRYLAFRMELSHPEQAMEKPVQKQLYEKYKLSESELESVFEHYENPPSGKSELLKLNHRIEQMHGKLNLLD